MRMLLFIVVVCLSGLIISARWKQNESASLSPINAVSETAKVGAVQHRRNVSQVESEIITITPTGFDPGEITRPKGPFVLGIDNRTGMEQVDLYLERENGGRLNASLNRKRKLSWRETIDFSPGRYILREANHEGWQCRITITPR